MKKLLWIGSIFFLFSIIALPASAKTLTGKVVRVLDGDTLEILSQDNTTTRIRLSEIDCPEKGGQPYGQKAKQYVIDLAAQKIVRVKVKKKDRYGRSIGEVFLPSGQSLNRILVAEGYAWWYQKYSNDGSLGKLEQLAKHEQKGLWRSPDPIPPWQWRRRNKK